MICKNDRHEELRYENNDSVPEISGRIFCFASLGGVPQNSITGRLTFLCMDYGVVIAKNQ